MMLMKEPVDALAFGSVVMGLVVLVDFKSLAVECLGNMP